jgi:hypothetical protein
MAWDWLTSRLYAMLVDQSEYHPHLAEHGCNLEWMGTLLGDYGHTLLRHKLLGVQQS